MGVIVIIVIIIITTITIIIILLALCLSPQSPSSSSSFILTIRLLESEVSVVFHNAATVKFNEDLNKVQQIYCLYHLELYFDLMLDLDRNIE